MLLASSYAWILDVAFFAIIVLGLVFGTARGFVKSVCKLAGTIFSVIIAVFFCTPLAGALEEWFSLTTLISNAIGSENVGGWITIAISFLSLIAAVKLGTWLLGAIGKGLIERSKVLNAIDRFLGGVLGVIEALLLIFILLLVCNWTNFAVVNEFIAESTVVSVIYESEWFLEMLALSKSIFQGFQGAAVMSIK
ncbi:MAG: CvpA family protein [Clostridia bacterium]|nr:CvpA family protein [Clostridia bacterium]